MNIFFKKIALKIIDLGLLLFTYLFSFFYKSKYIYVVNFTKDKEDLKERLSYYYPKYYLKELIFSNSVPFRACFSNEPVLQYGSKNFSLKFKNALLKNLFWVDSFENPNDGSEWIRFSNYVNNHKVNVKESKSIFDKYVFKLKQKGLKKAYIFGTGVSLDKAITKHWEDGYRIVCNTIVKDPTLWDHLNPNFIVAGDAIYHFGHTKFARTFRKDLKKRLHESDILFVYPEFFDSIVRRELGEFEDRLVPIPVNKHKNIHVNLTENFNLPEIGNVLALLLLPIGCTLSKHIYLWGFDGRSPKDKNKLFWSNSSKHAYENLLNSIQSAHPKFFEHFVPKNNLNKYVLNVHGDLLDQRLKIAEHIGYTFTMMHPTYTETLQKRFLSKGAL